MNSSLGCITYRYLQIQPEAFGSADFQIFQNKDQKPSRRTNSLPFHSHLRQHESFASQASRNLLSTRQFTWAISYNRQATAKKGDLMSKLLRAINLAASVCCATAAMAQDTPLPDGNATFDCLIDPARVTAVSAASNGILETVDVARGTKVKAGQVVARMRSSLEEAALHILETRASADATIHAQEAQVEYAKRRMDRARTLVKQAAQSVSQLEELEYNFAVATALLEQARQEKATAEAELARARIDLDTFLIRSPTDGVVIEVNARPGEYTSGDHPILKVAMMDPLHIEAFLPVELFRKVSVGQKVKIFPDAPVSGEYVTQITVMDAIFDTASRTFGIEADLPNPDGVLPAGHRCVLQLPEKKAP